MHSALTHIVGKIQCPLMIQEAVHVVISTLSFSGEKSFGHEGQMKRENVGGGGYIIINTCVISDSTLPSIVPASWRVNVVEINFQILNYSYKIVN